jgi:replicative DNA helicase
VSLPRGQVIPLPRVKPVRSDLPSAEQAERALVALGWMEAAWSSHLLGDALEIVQPEAFYSSQLGAVWGWMQDRRARGLPGDVNAFVDAYLGDERATERYGTLADATASPPDGVGFTIVGYARLVLDAHRRRNLLAACQAGARACQEMEAPEALAKAQEAIRAAEAGMGILSDNCTTADAIGEEFRQQIAEEQHALEHGGVIGLPYGFRALTRFGNIRPGRVEIVAGRPAMGKSQLVFQVQRRVARRCREINSGVTVLFELEMSKQEVFARWTSEIANVPYSRMQDRLTHDEYERVYCAAREIESLSHYLIVNDTPSISIEQIRRILTGIKAQYGAIAMVAIDYVGLVTTEAVIKERHLVLDHIAYECKAMAKSLETNIVLVAQLNRACEARTDKRPLMSDLRESGGLEQVADRCFFVFRPSYYDPDAAERGTEVICGKNRHGQTGTAVLGWCDGRFTEGMEPESRLDGWNCPPDEERYT